MLDVRKYLTPAACKSVIVLYVTQLSNAIPMIDNGDLHDTHYMVVQFRLQLDFGSHHAHFTRLRESGQQFLDDPADKENTPKSFHFTLISSLAEIILPNSRM